MSYRVMKTPEGCDLFESESDTVIELKKPEKEVKDLCRKLNLGSGFNGWTPSFVAKKF